MNIVWREDISVLKRWKVSASAWALFDSPSSCERTCCQRAVGERDVIYWGDEFVHALDVTYRGVKFRVYE
jgi:hypothetical protein